jgi:hypothetical protein
MKRWPAQLAIAVLVITIFPWSYPVYMLGKIPVCIASVYYCVKNYQKDKPQVSTFWYFLVIAILFNPVIPVHLYFSPLWVITDIVVAVYFYTYLRRK